MDKKPSLLDNIQTMLQGAKEKLEEAKQDRANKDPFPNRATTSFGVSMGLGLALESIFPPTHNRVDNERKPPNMVRIEPYNIIAVNVHSIARDVFTSIPEHVTEPNKLLAHRGFEQTILNELHILEGLFFGFDKEVVFYLPDFNFIASKINAGKKDTFTKRFTTNLLIYKALEKMKLETHLKILRGHRLYKLNFKSQYKVLMLTSLPTDLLNNGNIDLLEFHTGLLIDKLRFNKKYKTLGNNKPFNMLPYDELLLYLLGDNTVSMLPEHGEKIRRLVYECMIKEKWSPRTSIIRINQTLSKYPIIKNVLNNFNRLY